MTDAWVGVIGTLAGTVLGFGLQEYKAYRMVMHNKKAAVNESRIFLKKEIDDNHTFLNKGDSDRKSHLDHLKEGKAYHSFKLKGYLKYAEWDKYKFTITEKNSEIAKNLTDLYNLYIELEGFEGSADQLGSQWVEVYSNAYDKVNKEILN